MTKLAGGAFDFGIADIGAVLAARARSDMPVVAIHALYTHSPHSLFVLESSGIEDFQGLEGKRIGIPPGNSHRLYFPKVAERAGTDASQIVWVNTDGAAMAPLLIQKQLDAAPFYSIHHYYQIKAAESVGEAIRVLPFEEVGFAIYAASVVTTDSLIEENSELVERFLAAVRDTFLWARDNTDLPGADARSRHPAHGRAVRGARRADPRGDEPRAAAHPPRAAEDHRLRHPFDQRGGDARGPHRRDVARGRGVSRS